VCMIS